MLPSRGQRHRHATPASAEGFAEERSSAPRAIHRKSLVPKVGLEPTRVLPHLFLWRARWRLGGCGGGGAMAGWGREWGEGGARPRLCGGGGEAATAYTNPPAARGGGDRRESEGNSPDPQPPV